MRRKVRRVMMEVALVVLGLLALRAYQTRAHVTGQVPRLEARLLDGTTLVLGGPSPEPVMIHFWATWCGVCRVEEGSIQSVAQAARVISVVSRSGPSDSVLRTMRERGLSFTTVDDSSGALAQRFGVRAFPTSFFVGRDGTIRSSEVGYTTTLGLRARLWWAGL